MNIADAWAWTLGFMGAFVVFSGFAWLAMWESNYTTDAQVQKYRRLFWISLPLTALAWLALIWFGVLTGIYVGSGPVDIFGAGE